ARSPGSFLSIRRALVLEIPTLDEQSDSRIPAENYRILSNPMGIRRNPWYWIPTGSCPMSENA
ncbi:unnamed protein product, partial [Rotaria magnacalcarata]